MFLLSQFCITDPPQLVGNDPLIFYSGLGQAISLNITVRAFPEFSDPDSAFTWTMHSGLQITDGVTSTKQSDEIFYSVLLISSVKGEDYTSYTVTADNGVKQPVKFTLQLIERGMMLKLFLFYFSRYLGLKTTHIMMEHHLCLMLTKQYIHVNYNLVMGKKTFDYFENCNTSCTTLSDYPFQIIFLNILQNIFIQIFCVYKTLYASYIKWSDINHTLVMRENTLLFIIF